MQTFLPHRNFDKTAKHLDRKRLIKQSVENLQVLKSLAGLYKSMYNESIVKEILMRGYKNTTNAEFDRVYQDHFLMLESESPWWLGDEKLHYSHKGRLYEKDPDSYYMYSDFADYRQLGYTCCESCSYYWPTHVEAS
jgi:hypothetical protein